MIHTNQPLISPLLVGRMQEREYLGQALAAACQGQGTVVLLAGEAGVGKSRLAEEVRRQAAACGFDVLIGRCFEHDTGSAYALPIDALRTWLAPLPESAVIKMLGPRAAEVVKLLPELAYTIPNLQPTAPLDPEAEKQRLMESLYRVLAQSALPPKSTPLLLIAEDLHWSDENSLDSLHLLMRRAAHLPLIVVGTYRREARPPHLRHWLAQLGRERLVHEMVLGPLTLDEMGTMVGAILGLEDPPPVEAVERLYSLTEGNPFFVEELLKVLVADGTIFPQDGRWVLKSLEEINVPQSIQDAVYRRTAWLSPEAQHVLTLAAVAGRRFDFALLQEVAGYTEQELLEIFKELTAAQLVVEESAERFVFRHALTQQAVYAGLLARERRPLHKIIGTVLERLYAAALGTQAVYLSHHFYAAGEWDKALHYAQKAGEQAQALFEPRAAIEQWNRALAAVDHLPEPQARVPLLRGRGWAYEVLGQFDQARTDYEAALVFVHSQRDAQAEWQLLLDLGAMWCAQDYDQAGRYFQQALELARGCGNGQMLAHSLNRVGNWHLNLDQPHAALRYHQEALQLFQSAEDSRGQATTIDFLGMATAQCGDLAGSLRYYEQALRLSQALDDQAALATVWAALTFHEGFYVTETLVVVPTPLSEEARIGEPARQLARKIGWRAGEAFALLTLGQLHSYRGDYGRALAYAREALVIAAAIEHREWMAAAHCGLGRFYLDVLDPASARSHLTAALDLAQRARSIIWHRLAAALLATFHLAQGEPVEAEAVLATLPGMEQTEFTLVSRCCRLAKAQLYLALGEPVRALQVVDELISTAPNIRHTGVHPPPRLLLVRAEALLALQQETEAETVLRVAQASANALGAASLSWRILPRLATLYDSQRRRAEATAAAATARQLVEQIACTIPEQRMHERLIEQACRRLPQVVHRKQGRAAPAPGGLTHREGEVAKLIAQGQSDREIATELVITERTVTTHISHIFAKLDFHARTQIAAWVIGQSWNTPGDSHA